MKKKLSILLIALVGCAVAVSAQGRRGLRINEVMVQNDSNYVDDYGLHHAWIELYNSTYAPMEISSVYLSNDPAQPKKYPVPLGDVNTEIPPRQHVVFWADGEPNKGTFHLNFKLVPGQDNWIGVYDANGVTLIDSITVPASLIANQSYARVNDGEGSGKEAWGVRDGSAEAYITPSSNNKIIDTNSKVEMFAETDGNGFGLTLMAMCIVFSALLLLSLSFYAINRIGARISTRNKARSHGLETKSMPRDERPEHDSGEEIAAIVMALQEHLNAHDKESTILTINKVRKSYSPWSSKIYGLRELPRR
ncbi:lamin tail domain-containing protein [Barnesiella sp. WM24]|uniref:OadG family transporter subunit n=1 Tax=Barnesiella sp. WM24 TaxID=2558278 RepID=UPI0010717AB6|nr:OadG family transporter subunit [Barnesiella sp. WM24]TFU95121.1 lamin tail domain-containing protein [Barnesiella sp. WM24]